MRFRLCRLIPAAILSISLVSISILPVMAKYSSQIPRTAGAVLPALANSAWPMFQHDPQHTGCSPYVGPQTANLKWVFTLDAGHTNSIATASDGTLYVCAWNGGQRLYAVNPDGTEKWSNPTWHSMNSTPAVGSDGTIYVVQSDDLAAYYPDHTHKWSYAVPAFIFSHPAIGPDGTIYFTADNKLYAIRDNGSSAGHIWIQTVPDTFTGSSPAIATSGPNSGTIYVGTYDNSILYAFTDAGVQKWSYDIGSHLYDTSPAIGADGTIYINTGNGGLLAITDTGSAGTEKWEFDMAGGRCQASPAIGSDGTIYIGNNTDPGSVFWAVTDGGAAPTVKWQRNGLGATDASAVIGADDTVYYQNRGGTFYALDGADGSTKWSYSLGTSGITSAAIDAGGCVYVGTWNSKLYAFAPAAPTVTSIAPDQGTQGQTLNVVITGTNFYGLPAVSLGGANITVNSVTLNSLTQLTVNITISGNCAPGLYNVIVTTGGGNATLTNGFNVVSTTVETDNGLIEEGPVLPGAGPPGGGSSVPPSPQPTVQLPNITVPTASLSASKVAPGTPVTVTANVVNRSNAAGSTNLKLYVNGQQESSQGVFVNGGSNKPAVFTVIRNEPGTYAVYVGGTSAGSFTVEQLAPDIILFISGSLVLFALVGGVIYMTRKRPVR
ncbi:MAG: PQQ-binding-like beta-propeller repeat protein [Dehalococcoidia bacterium]